MMIRSMKCLKLWYVIAILQISVFPVFAEGNKSASGGTGKRREVWAEFYQISILKFGKLPKINIYGENDSLSKICFICDKGLFIYYHRDSVRNGISHIERVSHAKFLRYDAINRISFRHEDNREWFDLWYNETRELSF